MFLNILSGKDGAELETHEILIACEAIYGRFWQEQRMSENQAELSSPQDNFQLLIKTEHGTSIHFITKAVTMVENAAQFDSDNL